MNNLYKLPETWVWIAAESVCEIVSGFAFKSSDFCDNGIPAIKIANVSYGEFLWKQQEYLPTDFLEKYSEFQVRPGTLIMALTRPITNDTVKACLYPVNAPVGLLNQRVALLKPFEGYSQFFLLHLIQSNFFKRLIKSGLSETLQPNLSPQSLRQFAVPLPPLNEQRRIVAKIEALKARSQRVKEELEVIAPLLNQFRQSVLAAAFRGDLTADWREKNPDFEPASELLQEIREKCRERYEKECFTAQIERKRKPQKPKNFGIPTTDIQELSDVPESWCWIYFGELISALLIHYYVLGLRGKLSHQQGISVYRWRR